MSDTICPACCDTGRRLLPVDRGLEEYSCPVCIPWAGGFPGETVTRDGVTHFVIEPSAPGDLAVYRGFPD